MNTEQVRSAADVLAKIGDIPPPNLGIDLDSVLEAAPIFIRVLASSWAGRVIGFTGNEGDARLTVQRLGLRCDEVVVVATTEEKADAIYRSGVLAIVSDHEGLLRRIPNDRTRLHVLV
jgi:hypothetical protein